MRLEVNTQTGRPKAPRKNCKGNMTDFSLETN